MRFSVSTNWRDDLLPVFSAPEIGEVYGKLGRNFIGRGRPAYSLPNVSRRRAAVLRFARRLNADFASFHRMVAYKGSSISRDGFNAGQDAAEFVRKAFIRYYLRPSYLHRLDPSLIFGGLNLFWGRIRSLR